MLTLLKYWWKAFVTLFTICTLDLPFDISVNILTSAEICILHRVRLDCILHRVFKNPGFLFYMG